MPFNDQDRRYTLYLTKRTGIPDCKNGVAYRLHDYWGVRYVGDNDGISLELRPPMVSFEQPNTVQPLVEDESQGGYIEDIVILDGEGDPSSR